MLYVTLKLTLDATILRHKAWVLIVYIFCDLETKWQKKLLIPLFKKSTCL